MSQFNIWPKLGFTASPYSNHNLPGDEVGDQLFVGRDREIEQIQRRIGSAGTHPSVEGPAGVGKSSMLAVAGFRMMRACLEAGDGTLYLPTKSFFQASESLDDFEEGVYFQVAQTLITNRDRFQLAGVNSPDVDELHKWLNSIRFKSGGASALGFGGSGGTSPNTTQGFRSSGFPKFVREQLSWVFAEGTRGAVVCVLDNLELLQTSALAREVLEALRDRVFGLPGLRWVLCGSRGIVSRARSQRLSGFFDAPMRLGPLPFAESIDLVRRRIEYFKQENAFAPVSPEGFEHLYKVLNRNLRDALAYAQQFSDWIYEQYYLDGKDYPPAEDRFGLLEIWMADLASKALGDAKGIQPRVWQFFDQLAREGGSVNASEWKSYTFGRQQQMVSAVTALEKVNLVVREIDPDNASRSLATITPSGWLVAFERNSYAFPVV